MSTDATREQLVDSVIAQLVIKDPKAIEQVQDLLLWGLYGQDVFSQFGMGLSGYVFRQQRSSVVATVKVTEGGVPLVAFVTSAYTVSCVEQMFDLLYAGRLKWQKDRYPWI